MRQTHSVAKAVNTNLVARIGVEQIRARLVDEFGWFPREPSDPDYGVDLYVECADDGVPNGRLLGLQIKSGPSFFSEEVPAGIVFRANGRHLRYWLNHTLPVLVVLYEPDSKIAYWQIVSAENVADVGDGGKLIVPRQNILDARSAGRLAAIAGTAEIHPVDRELNHLRSERTWMAMLRDGGTVVIEIEEWVNKTAGRGQIQIRGTSPAAGDEVVRTWSVYLGSAPYEEVLPDLFPWASLDVDELLYDDYEEDDWLLEAGQYDKEEGRVIVYGESFDDWRTSNGRTGIRPYTVEQGEVARWRLELTLNELGRSFLCVDDHLRERLG